MKTMKHILIFIFFSLSFALFGQNDTHPNYTQSQLDSALKGTKYIDIPSHFNSNGDKNTWDINLKDLGDVINGKSNPSQIIALQDTTGCTSWTSASTNFQTDMPTADSLLFITINGTNYPINLPMDDGSTGSIPPATAALMQTAIGNAITSAGYSATTSVGASGIFTNITYQLTAGNSPLTIQYTIKTGGFYNNLVIAKSVPYNCTYTNRAIKPTDTQLAVNTCPAITLAYSEGDLDTLRVYDCNTNDWRIVGAEHDYNYSLSPLIVGVDTTGFILNKNGIPQDTVLLCSGGGNTVVDTRLQLSVANDSLKVEVIDVATNVVLSTSYFDDIINKPESLDWKIIGNSGTNSNVNFLGTTDAQDVVFKANNSEILRLEKSGLNYVGYTPSIRTDRNINIGNSTNGAAFVSLRKEQTGVFEVPGVFGFHGFEDYSNLTMTGTNNAYASLALAPILSGSSNYDHFVIGQLWGYYNSTGNVNRIVGLDVNIENNGGNATDYMGIRLRALHGTGTKTNNYGLYMEPVSGGTVSNYAIYSGGGNSLFNGDIALNNGDFTLNSTGRVFQTVSSQSKFGAANGMFTGADANPINTGVSFYSGGRFSIGITNGSPVLSVEGNGNVRVGDNGVPSERLDVVGNIKASSLVGTGTRIATASPTGVLGATSVATMFSSLSIVTGATSSDANTNAISAGVGVGEAYIWDDGSAIFMMIRK
jgi:hypothetical protein